MIFKNWSVATVCVYAACTVVLFKNWSVATVCCDAACYHRNFTTSPPQINHQPDATIFQFIILTFIYSSTCFGRSPAHHQELHDCSGSLWFYLLIVVTVVLCSWSGRPATRPRPTALLSPCSEGKTRGSYCSH